MTKISTDPPAFRVRPAQPEEAGVFFAQTPEQDALMGGIGHVRMDFGGSGKEFWHTWHPRGAESLNTPEFKAELQQVVDKLRETVLKDLSSMRRFCYENGGKIPGGWSQNYGYVVETEHYEYCLRCNPVPGDYQAYLSTVRKRPLTSWMRRRQQSPRNGCCARSVSLMKPAAQPRPSCALIPWISPRPS